MSETSTISPKRIDAQTSLYAKKGPLPNTFEVHRDASEPRITRHGRPQKASISLGVKEEKVDSVFYLDKAGSKGREKASFQ